MGCCQSENKQSTLSQSLFGEKLKEAIDSNSTKTVHLILELLSKKQQKDSVSFIDKEIIPISGHNFNALAYCMYKGNEKIFKYLYEKGAKLSVTEELFDSQGLRGINLICMKDHIELLKFYLPLYMETYNSVAISDKSFTIEFIDPPCKKKTFELAIHAACRSGNSTVIAYLYNYFKDKSYIPREFDIKSTNEEYGEDCALTACRRGNFIVVKFLYEICKADFTKLNKNKENAIMVCICGCNKSAKYSYLECISYLVEIVKVDVTYMYEEALVLADNKDIVSYLEMHLEAAGVHAKKSDLDKGTLNLRVVQDEENNANVPIFTDEVLGYLSSGNTNSAISSIANSYTKAADLSLIDIMVPE